MEVWLGDKIDGVLEEVLERREQEVGLGERGARDAEDKFGSVRTRDGCG